MNLLCPECGAELHEGALDCAHCGHDLDPIAEALGGKRHRPTRWLVLGVVAAVASVAALIFYVSGLSLVIRGDRLLSLVGSGILISRSSLICTLAPFFGFILASVVAVVMFKARYMREVVLGLIAGALVQFVIWVIALGGHAGLIFSGKLHIYMTGTVIIGPAAMFLIMYLLFLVLSGLLAAVLGWLVNEQATGKGLCLHCQKLYEVRPEPPQHCPNCHVALSTMRVNWTMLLIAAAATGAVYLLLMLALGKGLGFNYDCDPYKMSDTCREAYRQVFSSSGWMAFKNAKDTANAHLMIFHKWKYLGFMSLLMFLTPALLAWRLKRHARWTSGLSILINWGLATILMLVVVALAGGFDGAYLWFIKFHMLALIAWSVAGFMGTMVGLKLRARREPDLETLLE